MPAADSFDCVSAVLSVPDSEVTEGFTSASLRGGGGEAYSEEATE